MCFVLDRSPQNGTRWADAFWAGAVGKDGSVVLAGGSEGGFSGDSKGQRDFVVVKLDADGKELWRWQVCAHEPHRSAVLVVVVALWFVERLHCTCYLPFLRDHQQILVEFGMLCANAHTNAVWAGTVPIPCVTSKYVNVGSR